ncbi:MAG: hypothetical protein R3B09_02045 [Nannocystaceae bacterium]
MATTSRARVPTSTASALIVAVLALTAAACGYRPVDVEELAITAPIPPASERIHLPLYILRDTARIPDTMKATAPGGPTVDVYHVRTYVERDLRVAMSGLFDSVTVVDPTAQVPAGERMVAFVSVDELGLAYASATDHSWVVTMRFSFEIRIPGAPTHAYRFAGTVNGSVPLKDKQGTDEAFSSAFASGIARVVDGMLKSGIAGRLAARA